MASGLPADGATAGGVPRQEGRRGGGLEGGAGDGMHSSLGLWRRVGVRRLRVLCLHCRHKMPLRAAGPDLKVILTRPDFMHLSILNRMLTYTHRSPCVFALAAASLRGALR